MQAIILAAGMGKRLKAYTKDATKCMVKVNGKTLIEYTIEALAANKIEHYAFLLSHCPTPSPNAQTPFYTFKRRFRPLTFFPLLSISFSVNAAFIRKW